MEDWLNQLVEVIEGDSPADTQSVPWVSGKWVEVAATSEEASAGVRVLRELAPSEILRDDVRQIIFDEGPVAGFVAAMIWGFGPVSYGPHRVTQMLTNPRVDEAPLTVIEQLLVAAKDGGAQDGFGALWSAGRSRVYGLGIAFGTKALYFASTLETPGPQPLILDQFVYRGAERLLKAGLISVAAPVPDPRKYMTRTDYHGYCDWAAQVAAEASQHPDVVELALFQVGRNPAMFGSMII